MNDMAREEASIYRARGIMSEVVTSLSYPRNFLDITIFFRNFLDITILSNLFYYQI